ncbi:MAG: D-glycero-beta-D-manno-heptose 1-phosphate adenylyltransferase [Marinoscillum sp.]
MISSTYRNRINAWKEAGQTIVFTNGCFDLLHPGHIDSLEKCRSFGDRLVVGLNSDASVKILKGVDRPIMDAHSRKRCLDALTCVDMVIIFEDDNPEALIKEVLPDILAKGSDYDLSNIMGTDIVLRNGGKVEQISLVPGYSTTEIINKIRKQIDK